MTTKISQELRAFFDVEERNGDAMRRDDGIDYVQTLCTAAESLAQAPDDIIIEWFGFSTTRAAIECIAPLTQMMWLIIQHGPDTPLSEFEATP